MKVHRGTTVQTAFRIEYKTFETQKVDQIANETIDQIFGVNDGDYMIRNQMTHPTPGGKTYRVYLVEDNDKQMHEIYFEMVKIPSEGTTFL